VKPKAHNDMRWADRQRIARTQDRTVAHRSGFRSGLDRPRVLPLRHLLAAKVWSLPCKARCVAGQRPL